MERDLAMNIDFSAMESPELWRKKIRESHEATEEWYTLYEALDIGVLPAPDLCRSAPPTQRALKTIPVHKAFRKNNLLGHFFASREDEFVCVV